MIETIEFYKMRGSFSSGEYPLLAEDADLSDYLIHSVQKKVTAQLHIKMDVPDFTGSDIANIAKIGPYFYWITGYEQSTINNSSITYTLDMMAPTSLLHSSDTLTAYLERSPTYITKYLPVTFSDDVTELTDTEDVGNLITFTGLTGYTYYWVQITALYNGGGGVDYLKRYGCFAVVPNTSGYADVDIKQQASYKKADNSRGTYPSLQSIISAVENIVSGVTGSDVKDISISKRCPYQFWHGTVNNIYVLNLTDANGILFPPSSGLAHGDVYDLDAIADKVVPIVTTKTYTASDKISACGSFAVRDWNRNIVATFPASESLTFKTQTYADFSGIYTIISNGKELITIPEGKLPWDSSAWSEYRAYSMDADRQQLQNAIEYANYQYETDQQKLVGGLVTGATSNAIGGALVTGNPIGALAGVTGAVGGAAVSSYALDRDLALTYRHLFDDFDLSQKRARMAAGSSYNVGYGLIYVGLTLKEHDLMLGLVTPMHYSNDLLSDYTARYGYPCEGKQSVSVVEGYYKGIVPATDTLNGPVFDRLNMNMRQGFRFVDPGEPIAVNTIYYESVIYHTDEFTEFAIYKNVRWLGMDAYFKNTLNQVYPCLLMRHSPGASYIWYMSQGDGSVIGDGIELIEGSEEHHHSSKLVVMYDDVWGFSPSDKIYASEMPQGLSELLISGNFNLRMI